jgi:hypothetical protein
VAGLSYSNTKIISGRTFLLTKATELASCLESSTFSSRNGWLSWCRIKSRRLRGLERNWGTAKTKSKVIARVSSSQVSSAGNGLSFLVDPLPLRGVTPSVLCHLSYAVEKGVLMYNLLQGLPTNIELGPSITSTRQQWPELTDYDLQHSWSPEPSCRCTELATLTISPASNR